MKLIGMLDSPYVRRTAISFNYLAIEFEHVALSVFSTFKAFQNINPVVKAPSLILDTGEVLMDSNLIIDYAETLCGRRLMPATLYDRTQDLRIIGLSLAACEKTVQIIYERNLRPPEKRHEPWLTRIINQLLAACYALEQEIAQGHFAFTRGAASQAGITTAVCWQFVQSVCGSLVMAEQYPALMALSATAEQAPEFMAYPPDGPGVVAIP